MFGGGSVVIIVFQTLAILMVFDLDIKTEANPWQCEECMRSNSCKPPQCSCCNDHMPLVMTKDTPQMVFFTFDDAVTPPVANFYKQLFDPSRKNPNGCPITMTLFVSHANTVYNLVKDFYTRGMEVGVHSVSHTQPDVNTFQKEAQQQKENLAQFAKIPIEKIKGWRSPFLKPLGDKQPSILQILNYTYDATLTISNQRAGDAPVPFTLDYGWPYDCKIKPCPKAKHPGFWEVPVVSLMDYNNRFECVYVDGCHSPPPNEEAAFRFLMSNFEQNYEGNRTPFGINMHASWFYFPERLRAMDRFILKLGTINDVYIVSISQMIEWLKDPTPLSQLEHFKPWGCNSKNEKSTELTKPHLSVKSSYSKTQNQFNNTEFEMKKNHGAQFVNTNAFNNRKARTKSLYHGAITQKLQYVDFRNIDLKSKIGKSDTTPSLPWKMTLKDQTSKQNIKWQQLYTSPHNIETNKKSLSKTLTRPKLYGKASINDKEHSADPFHGIHNDFNIQHIIPSNTAKSNFATKRMISENETATNSINFKLKAKKGKQMDFSNKLQIFYVRKPVSKGLFVNVNGNFDRSELNQFPEKNNDENSENIDTTAKNSFCNDCHLPNCHCMTKTPSIGLPKNQIPQFVFITIEGVLNFHAFSRIRSLFGQGRKNPDNCLISGTAFVKMEKYSHRFVNQLLNIGMELAILDTEKSALQSIQRNINNTKLGLIQNSQLTLDDIKGYRSIEQFDKILANFDSLTNDLLYDSSFVTNEVTWPYSLSVNICNHNSCQHRTNNKTFWEFPKVKLTDTNGKKICIQAKSCQNQHFPALDTYNLLKNTFVNHYQSNKVPFGIHLHQDWFKSSSYTILAGLSTFIDEMLQRDDVFIVSIEKLLNWIQNPISLTKLVANKLC